MSSLSRRILFWILFACFAAGSVWWILFVPYIPGRVLSSMPGHATIVMQHDQLADRWTNVSQNVMVKILASALGVKPEEWAVYATDPGWREFMKIAGRREIVMGYVPDLGDQSKGNWVMASWIGGESQRLRWTYPWFHIKGLERIRDIGGWPAWTWKSPQWRLTIVLAEGVMLATAAEDSQTVQILVDTYNGNFPSIVDRPDRNAMVKQLVEAPVPDRGWYTPPSISGSDYWMIEMNLSGSNQVTGTIRTPKPPHYATPPIQADWKDLSQLWSDKPLGAVAAGLDSVLLALEHQKNTSLLVMLREIILRSGAETAAIALFGGEYSGRITAIKVPAIMVAIQPRDPVDLGTFLPPLVDRWNATHRLGLVAVPFEAEGRKIWRIEGTTGGLYGKLSSEQQVALTTIGSWIVISSNYGTLEKLLKEPADQAVAGAPVMDEMNGLAEGSIGCAALDLASSAKVFRLALSAYYLKLKFEGSSKAAEQSKKINEMKAWLDTFALMENLRVRAVSGPDMFQFEFEAGPEEE